MDLTWLALILGVAVGTLFLFVALVAVILFLWPRKGKLGINLARVNCPRCGEPMPAFRKPKNMRQTLWGGWTCERCGCEIDKYGKQIAT